MAGKIPEDTLQAIRERVSIVEVVSGYVTLKKAGRNHVGLCPFHSEKTPSFTVNDDRGLFHCFGCGAGGTVFTFLMRADRIEFPEAVEMLARRAGVTLPQRSEAEPGGDPRDGLVELNETAQRCFREALQSAAGAAARQYMEKRGLRAATIERYGIGFCPRNGSGLVRTLGGNGARMQKAVDLGLLGRRADGSVYDRFWGRVTFPIRHGRGHILGFGGRTLGTEHPKYLNSPESSLFHKGQVLYGLFEARAAIREVERVVIVEGYLDALALVEAGIGYAVASLGTALSTTQLRLARRFAPEVVVFFDGDRAGQEAAVRSFTLCAEAGVWGLGAFLPEGFDPDTYVRARGASAARSLLEQATPLADFFIHRLDPGPQASCAAARTRRRARRPGHRPVSGSALQPPGAPGRTTAARRRGGFPRDAIEPRDAACCATEGAGNARDADASRRINVVGGNGIGSRRCGACKPSRHHRRLSQLHPCHRGPLGDRCLGKRWQQRRGVGAVAAACCRTRDGWPAR